MHLRHPTHQYITWPDPVAEAKMSIGGGSSPFPSLPLSSPLLPPFLRLKVKNQSPSRASRPIGRRWSPFPKTLSQTPVFTLRDHGYGASVSRGVSVYVPAVKPVPNYTAWWQRQMCVNYLPKVVTRQCPGAELNLRLWVTSGLQVRHVTTEPLKSRTPKI